MAGLLLAIPRYIFKLPTYAKRPTVAAATASRMSHEPSPHPTLSE